MERTKRISGRANAAVGRRRTTNGKGWQIRERDERGEKRKKREEDGSLAPPHPYETSTKRDLRGLSCSLHELPLGVSAQTCGENKRAQAWHGYRGL